MSDVPAIVRKFSEKDADAEILHTTYNSVTPTPGYGDSGYKIELVEYECPECGFDRMLRRVDVSPETPDEVRYHCLNPNCVYYLRDKYSYACKGSYPNRVASNPKITGKNV